MLDAMYDMPFKKSNGLLGREISLGLYWKILALFYGPKVVPSFIANHILTPKKKIKIVHNIYRLLTFKNAHSH